MTTEAEKRSFKVFGFPIRLHPSWFIIVALVTWSLAAGYFPNNYPSLANNTYWVLGIAGALGLFASVIIHEFCHSLVARRYGLGVQGITLFLFGGAAELVKEPSSPKSEFWIAIAGPITSFVLSGLFYIIASQSILPIPLIALSQYLGMINLVLAIFNLVPAFPLDGGRILRSILWQWKGQLDWATKIASRMGAWFAWALIILGLVSIATGLFVGGLWWILLGAFLRMSANGAYEQLKVRQYLKGLPVSQFMQTNPITVPPNMTLSDFVENIVYRHQPSTVPIVEDGELKGCVDINKIKRLPHREWTKHHVSDLAKSCPVDAQATPQSDVSEALEKMQSSGQTSLIITIDNRLLGILRLQDLTEFISTKSRWEQETA